MNTQKKTVRDLDVSGKKVLLRCDFNVPLDKATGAITDDKRIAASLPTIQYLLQHGAAVIACSHLGRPKGQVKPELSLRPVADRLAQLLGQPVALAEDVAGPDSAEKAAALQPGQVLLLENLRFRPEEEANDPDFAKALASLADVFVSDAFGTVHRAHASTAGVAAYLPAVAGLLVEKELQFLGGALNEPKLPFVSILGGSKVSDKIGVLESLLTKADAILIGGGMSYTFTKALGGHIGSSLCEEDKLNFALSVIEKAKEHGVQLLLPTDSVCAKEFAADAQPVTLSAREIPDDMMGLDIGPETAKAYAQVIAQAGTVVWNGPMGVFEFPAFAKGTQAVADAMADSSAVTIIGGGDSAAAAQQMGVADRMTHISTGGGASLEFLEGKELPGVACLLDR